MAAPDEFASLALTGDPTQAAPPGSVGWRFAPGDEVGHNRMGVVDRAADGAFGREVAVEVLSQEYGTDSGAARRFAERIGQMDRRVRALGQE